MNKTPQEMAEEYAKPLKGVDNGTMYLFARDTYLAGLAEGERRGLQKAVDMGSYPCECGVIDELRALIPQPAPSAGERG